MPHDRRQNDDASSPESGDRRQSQRREEPRVEVDLWAEETQEDAVYYRRVANLSPSGVFFDHGIPSAVGAKVKLRFRLPGDETPIEATGTVARADWEPEHLAAGVRFEAMSATDRERIERFVEAHLHGLNDAP